MRYLWYVISGALIGIVSSVMLSAQTSTFIDYATGGAFDATAQDALTWSDGANASNVWTFDVSGTDTTMTFGNNTIALGSGNGFGWSTDLFLYRDAANVLAQRNGTSTQKFNLYHTFTDASNYERLSFYSDAANHYIAAEAAGTGTGGSLKLIALNTNNIGSTTVTLNAASIPRFHQDIPSSTSGGGPFFEFEVGGGGAGFTGANVEQVAYGVTLQASQTGTSNYVAIEADVTETTVGSGSNYLYRGLVDASTRWGVLNSGIMLRSVTAGITASTTQTQGQGALTREVNEVSTVANANDTVTLPSAIAGMRIVIINNDSADTLQIFPASGDDLGAGVDTATTLAAGANVVYQAYDATNWESI